MEQLSIAFTPENPEDFAECEIDQEFPPEQLIILGKTFNIELLEPDQHEDVDGQMLLGEQLIQLRLQPSLEYNQDTLLHESLHGVDEILGLGLKEYQIHQLAAGLMSIFKQNPEFVEWLMK